MIWGEFLKLSIIFQSPNRDLMIFYLFASNEEMEVKIESVQSLRISGDIFTNRQDLLHLTTLSMAQMLESSSQSVSLSSSEQR